MRTAINILAAVLLVLLLLLRERFQDAIDRLERGEPSDYAVLRILMAPAAVTLAAFLVLAVWALVAAGYLAPAALLLVIVGLYVARIASMRPKPRA